MLNKDRTVDRSQGMVPVNFDTVTRFERNPKDKDIREFIGK